MIETKGNFKYEVTDDLHLNVWYATDNEVEVPPFWYQNVKETGEPWSSVEEILDYLYPRLDRLEKEQSNTTPEE